LTSELLEPDGRAQRRPLQPAAASAAWWACELSTVDEPTMQIPNLGAALPGGAELRDTPDPAVLAAADLDAEIDDLGWTVLCLPLSTLMGVIGRRSRLDAARFAWNCAV